MTQATHPQSTGDIIAQLMAEAQSHSDFSKRMQAERTAEYVSRGDLDSCYKGIEPSETIYWQAADRIADLTLAAARLTQRVKVLEGSLKEIDGMPYYTGEIPVTQIEGLRARYHKALDIARTTLTHGEGK